MINEKVIFKSSDGYKIIVGESKETDRKGMLAAKMELPLGAKIELGHFSAKQLLLMKQDFDAKLVQNINQYNAVVQQNQNLQQELSAYREALVAISQNSDCVCSLDDTCRPQRIAMNALAGINSHASVDEQQLKKKIIEFLTEMSSQNNRGTRFPYYFSIVDFNDNFVQDDRGDFFFDSASGSFLEIAPILRDWYNCGLIELNEEDHFEDILNNIGTYLEDERVEKWIETYSDNIIQRFANESVSWSDGIFFTEKDAEAYLESARNHHSAEAKTYVDCFNKWGRSSQTEEFLTNLFNYFGVKVPPEMYYDSKKAKEGTEQ